MSSVPPPSPLGPGYRLDRYELLCPIAHGGMAEVWVARMVGKHGFERHVAVKTIKPELADDMHFQRMFLDEAHIAANIEHPNVAQILDLGEQHGVLYLAMEYVDGESLLKLLRAVEKHNGKLPLGVVLRVIADAAAGLHAAHELRDKDGQLLGVVHRDVSPHNILVNQKGVAKLIDFGVAKVRERRAGDTNSGELKGKINYMAPEQAMGRPVDRRSDVFALGAVLYHLLSGRLPHDAPNQLATLHRLTSGALPIPLPDAIPAVVRDVVKRAMAHDAERRTPTAADLQRGIEQAMAELHLATTTDDVAAFLREQVSDRLEARRKAIQAAVDAATERARVNKELAVGIDSPASDSLPGTTRSPRRRTGPSDETLPGDTVSSLEKSPRHRPIVIAVFAVIALLLVFLIGRTTAHKEPAAAAASTPMIVEAKSIEAPPSATGAPGPSPSVVPSASASASATAPPKKKPTLPKPAPTTTVKKKKKIDDGF